MDDLPRKNSWEEEDLAIHREEDNPGDQEDHPEDQEDHPEDQEDHPEDQEDHPEDQEDHPEDQEDHPEDQEDHPEDQEDHPEDQEDHPEDQGEAELSKGKPRDLPTSSLVENHKYSKETDQKLRNLSPSGTCSSELITQTQRSKTPTKEA